MLGPFTIVDVLFQLAGFVVLLLILKKYAFGPIMDMMEKREKHVAEQISTAEKNREESEKYLEEQREAIKTARAEAKEIVENARKQAERQEKDIIANAEKQAERKLQEALASIKQEEEQAISALREQVSTLSVLVATKVIEKELDDKEQEKLIQETLKEVGQTV
ncbi:MULTISPECIES: F0F1 ATP synthase subunit B [Alteribacter]|uniref:ATP synthase subunit b n=1 Tax=Alteribacter keqinensis TaxID=2483800 RepID=A0A3M7TRC4_9BACI|nr:F0F1 ATP synthase subunit B [Alteribacter keqinensis]MBM7095589.1 F0F1 ATP synthase subunit B [Alteribacter salitolerans]RNA67817.1 ATP synthase F0 subunit B [Alteribacter keqinensis]